MDQSSVIRAKVRFQIDPFFPTASYSLSPQFATAVEGTTYTSHKGAGYAGTAIHEANGEVTVTFRMNDLVPGLSPYPLTNPLKIRFEILQHRDRTHSVSSGHTPFFEYPMRNAS